MPSDTQTAPASKKRIWAARILSGLPVLFLLFDAIIKLIKIRPVVEAFTNVGYPPDSLFRSESSSWSASPSM